LLNRQDQALTTLNFRLKPLIKRSQQRTALRQDLIFSMTNDLRQVPEQLTRALFGSGTDSRQALIGNHRFDKFVSIYHTADIAAAEKRDLEDVADLWQKLDKDAHDILRLETQKSEALGQFSQSYRTLLSTISKVLPAVRPEEIIQRKDAIFRAIQK